MIRNVYVITITLLLTAPASAGGVGEAKAKGHACEQTTGYLHAAANTPEDVKALVKNVNAERNDQYAKIATDNGVAVDQVAKLTAQKLLTSAPQHACK